MFSSFQSRMGLSFLLGIFGNKKKPLFKVSPSNSGPTILVLTSGNNNYFRTPKTTLLIALTL